MISLAADHHAKGDIGIESPAFRRQRNCPGQFERTGHGDGFMAVSGGLDRRPRALKQHIIEVRIKSRLSNQDIRQAISPEP